MSNVRTVSGNGPSDEESKKLAAYQKQMAEKRIREVEAVDPDEQARQQRFRNLVQPEDDEKQTPVQPPSPYETAFYASSQNRPAPVVDPTNIIPSPSYSPSPDMDYLAPVEEDQVSDQGLPQSGQFYYEQPPTDTPAPEQPQFIESPPKQSQPKTQGQQTPLPKSHLKRSPPPPLPGRPQAPKEPSPFAPQPPKVTKMGTPPAMHGKPAKEHQKEQQAEPQTPPGPLPMPHPFQQQSTPFNRPTERKVETGSRHTGLPTRPTEQKRAPSPFEPVFRDAKEPKKDEKQKSKEKPFEVTPVSTSLLPDSVQPIVQAAVASAAPYFTNNEHINIFAQMIGTIRVMMTPPEVSRTEFVINSPNMQGSKFFGVTIELTKYRSDPHSFHVVLTGENDQIEALQKAIPQFEMAFQANKHEFDIKIRADYKPVFHRKEKGSEKGEKDR